MSVTTCVAVKASDPWCRSASTQWWSLPARLAGGGSRFEGRSKAAIFGNPTRTSCSVANPTVRQSAVLIGVPVWTFVA